MNFQQYVKPELLILVPVLYLLAEGIKKTEISTKYIPAFLGVCGIAMSMVYIISNDPINSSQELASALFSSITQGILIAGASVYTNELIKQSKRED